MTDTCAIDVRVRLPRTLADEVERVAEREPEMLSRMVTYAVTRRAVFEHLAAREFTGVRQVESGA